MDIISHSYSIMSRIIISKYTHLCSLTGCYLYDIWHKVIMNTVRVFTYSTKCMSTNRTEITKNDYITLIISLLNIHQHLFKHDLCPTIRICTTPFRTILCYGNFNWSAIDCCATTEDNILATIVSHYINKNKCFSNESVYIRMVFCNFK